MQRARSSFVGRVLETQRDAASAASSAIKSQLHDNPYLRLFRFRSNDILKAYVATPTASPVARQAHSAYASLKPSESAETMNAVANRVDDEWGDVTVPNHDSLIPHALAAEESSSPTGAPRVGLGPLFAIGSVIAMACALPVIGWAAHRPNSANGTAGEEATDAPIAQVANPPGVAPRNAPATAPGVPGSDALSGFGSASGRAANEKGHRKHLPVSGKRTGNDRVAGLASAVAGLAGAAAEPPGAIDSTGAPTEPRAAGSLVGARPDRAATDAKGAPAKPGTGRLSARGSGGASIEDQAAAELSSALK